MAALPKVTLPERLETNLFGGHAWIYREHVPAGFSAPHGSFVRVRCGRFDGFALWDQESALALRIYSRSELPSSAWYERRLREAWQLRAPLLDQGTNAFRWVHGEADGLPGIVIDYYAGHAVMICDGTACEVIGPDVAACVNKVQATLSVLQRRRHGSAETGEEKLQVLYGSAPAESLIVEENGLKMRTDLRSGQKTGLFLDQRENRAYIGELSAGRRVLNLFSYSGAFSLYALRGGAKQAIDVDSAPLAAEDARENLRLNGIDPSRHTFVVGDVFEYLEAERTKKQSYDLVICDPPTFGRSKVHLDKALNAYARVNAAGMKVCAEGGLYAAASCTARVTPSAFKQALADAARRAQRRLQLIQERGQALDHPELISHPESRYLKFVLGRSLARI
jgi:23S rRNA (cytosine1962-C5)-methyltransferase